MHVIHIGQGRFAGPASWDEITPRQFRQYLNWLASGADIAGMFTLLQLWYGIRYRHSRLLDDDQRTDLLAVLDWITTPPSRWMLPRLRVGFDQIIGPGNDLEYLTFGEFMYAQAAFDRYLDDNDVTHLPELIAALYRYRARPWQIAGYAQRQPFDPRKHERTTRQMRSLPLAIQLGIVLNFQGCLETFPAQFPCLFSGKGSAGDGSYTWLDVGLSLARQTSALGTFAQMESTNLFLVLTSLDAIMSEQKTMADRLKK